MRVVARQSGPIPRWSPCVTTIRPGTFHRKPAPELAGRSRSNCAHGGSSAGLGEMLPEGWLCQAMSALELRARDVGASAVLLGLQRPVVDPVVKLSATHPKNASRFGHFEAQCRQESLRRLFTHPFLSHDLTSHPTRSHADLAGSASTLESQLSSRICVVVERKWNDRDRRASRKTSETKHVVSTERVSQERAGAAVPPRAMKLRMYEGRAFSPGKAWTTVDITFAPSGTGHRPPTESPRPRTQKRSSRHCLAS